MNDLIIYGASGHGKVVYDAALKSDKHDVIFYDDDVKKKSILNQRITHELPKDGSVVVAVGDNRIRQKLVSQVTLDFEKAIIHPSSVLGVDVEIGEGTVVFAGSVINPDVKIGKHVIINTKATVEHDCDIENFVHISPNATLCGTVEVGEGTQIGAGAVVLPNLKIGKWCIIAAGAVVTRNIPDHSKVIGVPGKIVGTTDA
ncbi:hypothetical protein BST97_06990 [Nonlabens spongiae]|uniref:PglD N-terminal domain-containing protein n=1 Tax=Nonlabens spongiae TaxID=331648 RepID=A0A1W6MJK8_9FLAO|nr:acetyltransferase [Nonlabens spongiae]ARN77763.1 hypothetical protein BST97_06990 [Nonlabens spongiae]